MFNTFKNGMQILYSTPLEARVYGEIVKRCRNRAFVEVKSTHTGMIEIIHRDDIITAI